MILDLLGLIVLVILKVIVDHIFILSVLIVEPPQILVDSFMMNESIH